MMPLPSEKRSPRLKLAAREIDPSLDDLGCTICPGSQYDSASEEIEGIARACGVMDSISEGGSREISIPELRLATPTQWREDVPEPLCRLNAFFVK